MKQQPVFELGVAEGETVIVACLSPGMKLVQLFVGPLVLVHHEPGFVGGSQLLLPEMVLHPFQYLWRGAIMATFETVHPDHRLLVIEDGEILRLGLHAFHRDHEQFAVATLAKGSLESASLRWHQSSSSLSSVRQGLVK